MLSPAAQRRLAGWSFLMPGLAGFLAAVVSFGSGRPQLVILLAGAIFPGAFFPFIPVLQPDKPNVLIMDTLLAAFVLLCGMGAVVGVRLLMDLPSGIVTRRILPALWLPLFPLGTFAGLNALIQGRQAELARPTLASAFAVWPPRPSVLWPRSRSPSLGRRWEWSSPARRPR